MKHYTTVVSLPSPDLLLALREFVFSQMLKGKKKPSLVTALM